MRTGLKTEPGKVGRSSAAGKVQGSEISWILKEISPEYSLEGLMQKLKLQYFGHLMQGADSLEKILRLGKTEGKRRRGRQWMRWLHSITNSMDMNLSKLWDIVEDRGACCNPGRHKELAMTEWLNNHIRTMKPHTAKIYSTYSR